MSRKDFETATTDSLIAFVRNADGVIAANVEAERRETCPISKRGLGIQILANREYRFMYAKELEYRGVCV